MNPGKLVIIESPYSGNLDKHIEYARKCVKHSLMCGENPFASHLLYTQDGILDDSNPEERQRGINAGFAWGKHADLVAVYIDYGISIGMKRGIEQALRNNINIEYRSFENES